MALSFPSNPAVNSTHTAQNGQVYIYDGSKWTSQSSIGTGIGTYTLPTASTSVLGGVKIDGSTFTISSGVISASGGGQGPAGPQGPQGPAGEIGAQGPQGPSESGVGSFGQYWQSMNKALYRKYTNSTGKPIAVVLNGMGMGNAWDISIYVNDVGVCSTSHRGGYPSFIFCIVPAGHTYYAVSGQYPTINALTGWKELRDGGTDDSGSYVDPPGGVPQPPPPSPPSPPFDGGNN